MRGGSGVRHDVIDQSSGLILPEDVESEPVILGRRDVLWLGGGAALASLSGAGLLLPEQVAARRRRESIGATRYVKLNVPRLKQRTQMGCGRTCVAMVLQYFGYDIDPEDVNLKQQLPDNAHIRQIQAAFARTTNQALTGRYFKTGPNSWFSSLQRELTRAPVNPVIALIPNANVLNPSSRYKGGHYVVITGFDSSENEIYWNDPANGKQYWGTKGHVRKAWGKQGEPDAKPWQGVYPQ
jgi:predicted double-glycine peptidase